MSTWSDGIQDKSNLDGMDDLKSYMAANSSNQDVKYVFRAWNDSVTESLATTPESTEPTEVLDPP